MAQYLEMSYTASCRNVLSLERPLASSKSGRISSVGGKRLISNNSLVRSAGGASCGASKVAMLLVALDPHMVVQVVAAIVRMIKELC